MEFTLFMIFSFIEAIALYYFMFRLFKIDLHFPSIAFASIIGSYASYTLRVSVVLPNVDIFVQVALIIAFVSLLFQVPIYYAILMAIISYVSYVLIQIGWLFLITTTVSLPEDLDPTQLSIYAVQTGTAVVVSFIGWLIHKKRKGFSFVPHSSFVPVKIKTFQIALLVLYILTFCSIPATYLLLDKLNPIFSLTPLIIGLLLAICLYTAYRSDRAHD